MCFIKPSQTDYWPGVPIIDTQSTFVSLTTISLKWSPPFQLNGVITKYKVCWHSTDSSVSCIDTLVAQIGSYVITNLRPGTTYHVLLSAFTKIGEGPADTTQRKTNESDLHGNKLRATLVVGVSDDTTQIGFTLPRIKSSESSKIQYFCVIVKRWSTNENENVLRATPQSDLTNFDNSNSGKKAYISIIKNDYQSDMKIIVGDNVETTLITRRKRRGVIEYRNAPLNENIQYAIFIRVFYDKNGASFQNSDVLVKATAFADADKDSEDWKLLIGIIVFPILVTILLILIVYFVYQNRTLKRSIASIILRNKETTNATKNDVVYDHPFDTRGDRDDEMTYDDVRVDDPTYTALNYRTGNEDEDHTYSHLNEMQENETEI
ncbi:Receptor-type tyrosine- phosphatase delta [Paramuricea clavata]|uniref:Receptor-type tyrosine- phosphatase delta n=1 Tax=Paramuricea clavata TaxID=317549 RepID=A0A6S7G883_PARCT|nr:Receptor-type tyrosine- phosphatase delta [Paramuricea clavata]